MTLALRLSGENEKKKNLKKKKWRDGEERRWLEKKNKSNSEFVEKKINERIWIQRFLTQIYEPGIILV